MSGIFGIVDSKRRSDLNYLANSMTQAMSHRKWFVAEHFVDPAQPVAMGRIGIGLFNRASQPVWNADHTIALVMAGEFYNQDRLHKGPHQPYSDETLALALYEQKGENFASELEGAYVIAIWDRLRQRLVVTNDRFGLYPLYYSYQFGKLIFAPEMKGVLCDPHFIKKLDKVALAEYIRFQYLLGDKTFFEDLTLFPNGHVLVYDLEPNHLRVEPYWSLSQLPALQSTITFAEAVEEAGRLLKIAVDKRTRSGYQLGLYLSAGVDSRVILGLLEPDLFPIHTLTFGAPGSRDMVYAPQIAAKMGTQHHSIPFQGGEWVKDYADFHLQLTEGFHSWIHAHGLNTLDYGRSLMEVNLTGLHGAEMNWEDPALYGAPDEVAFTTHLFGALCQETTWPSMTEAEAHVAFAPEFSSSMQNLAYDSFCSELIKCQQLSFHQRIIHFSLAADRRLYQYYTVFHRAFIEQRFPFYDYDYFEFIHSLPPAMRFKRKLRRAMILKMMRPLARIPYDKDNLPITDGLLPLFTAKTVRKTKSLLNRLKVVEFPGYATLYADYENWLRRELREWGQGILLGEQTLQRNIFNPDYLNSLWRRHQSGVEIHTIGKLAPIMTYEMMLRKFYD